jgi:RNAse (barnase) inhibitor barstar
MGGTISMNVFIVKCGDEKICETTNYYRAIEMCREVNAKYGDNSASLWKINTNETNRLHTGVRVNISDKSITRT